jgi:hypothetical protein
MPIANKICRQSFDGVSRHADRANRTNLSAQRNRATNYCMLSLENNSIINVGNMISQPFKIYKIGSFV